MCHMRHEVDFFLLTVSCLEELAGSTSSLWNRNTRADAHSLLLAMLQFSFCVTLVTTYSVYWLTPRGWVWSFKDDMLVLPVHTERLRGWRLQFRVFIPTSQHPMLAVMLKLSWWLQVSVLRRPSHALLAGSNIVRTSLLRAAQSSTVSTSQFNHLVEHMIWIHDLMHRVLWCTFIKQQSKSSCVYCHLQLLLQSYHQICKITRTSCNFMTMTYPAQYPLSLR